MKSSKCTHQFRSVSRTAANPPIESRDNVCQFVVHSPPYQLTRDHSDRETLQISGHVNLGPLRVHYKDEDWFSQAASLCVASTILTPSSRNGIQRVVLNYEAKLPTSVFFVNAWIRIVQYHILLRRVNPILSFSLEHPPFIKFITLAIGGGISGPIATLPSYLFSHKILDFCNIGRKMIFSIELIIEADICNTHVYPCLAFGLQGN